MTTIQFSMECAAQQCKVDDLLSGGCLKCRLQVTDDKEKDFLTSLFISVKLKNFGVSFDCARR